MPDWPPSRPLEKGSLMADFGITAQGPNMFFMSGELDMATVPIMKVAISDAVSRGGPITIDMADLTFMDSSGVGAIVRSVQSLPRGCIVLHGAHEGSRSARTDGCERGIETFTSSRAWKAEIRR